MKTLAIISLGLGLGLISALVTALFKKLLRKISYNNTKLIVFFISLVGSYLLTKAIVFSLVFALAAEASFTITLFLIFKKNE